MKRAISLVALLGAASALAPLDGPPVLIESRKTFGDARRYCREFFGTDVAVLASAERQTAMALGRTGSRSCPWTKRC